MRPLLVVLGTRPDAIKLAPVVREARRRGWPVDILATGQHAALFADTGFPAEFPLTALDTPNMGDPFAFADAALARLRGWVYDQPAHLTVVQGDTSSAWAGGRFAVERGWSLIHLEAGLRTGDLADPWPEEGFRRDLDRWAALRLAPTPLALKTLMDEGLGQGSVLVGNTVVDALHALGVLYVPMPLRPRIVLVTLHRRESWGEPLAHIVEGIRAVALEHENRHGYVFRWPAHLAPAVQLAASGVRDWTRTWKTAANVWVEEPMPYPRFVRTLAYARAVVTDSGGVVEEAATLGVPCVIARDQTERMEAVRAGHALLAGRTADGIATALRQCINGVVSSRPSLVFGDGTAAQGACDAIARAFA